MENQTPQPLSNTSSEQLELARVLAQVGQFTRTPYGSEKIAQLKFSSERAQVEQWLDEVAEMQGLLESEDFIPLYEVPDVRPHLEAIRPENAFLEPRQLLDIRQNLEMFSELKRFLNRLDENTSRLRKYSEHLHTHRHLSHQIEKTIESSADVRDDASPELRKIRRQIGGLEAQLRRLLQKLQKRYAEYAQEDIVTLRDGRMVLGIKHQWINRVNGIVHGTSATGATVFIEPMETLPLSNQIQGLRIEERSEIIRILRFLTDLVRQVREDLWYGIDLVGTLDSIYARARYAGEIQASRPKLAPSRVLRLKEARHPLLISKVGREKVTPLEVTLGDGFTTLVVTGPNAGGKTVALKTIGLLALMVQHGLLVPAHPDSEFPLYSEVLTDIGDRQSLEQDLSTFSAHIVRLRDILAAATASSLVLLDEVGTGTDPKEGAALAMAILHALTRQQVPTVATTHHGELKAFAHLEPGMENASMEFDLHSLQPTYRLRMGIPGSSYAFEIARRYGLPEAVIEQARAYLGEEAQALEKLTLQLEKQIQQLEQQRRELSIKLSEAEANRKLYLERLEALKREKQARRRQAAEEAAQLVQEARAQIEHLVADIRQSQASSQAIKKAHKALQHLERTAREVLQETAPPATPKPPAEPRVGDTVWIEGLNNFGELLSLPDEKGKALVLVGNVKLNVDAEKIRLTSPDKPPGSAPTPTRRRVQVDELDAGVLPEVDVRGLDSETALEAVDQFLDRALQQGWKEVRIIHGKGTGTLRRRIHQFLTGDKRVAAKRLGKWGEGDTGVTVVTLSE
ncbi:MAG: endonuclease MutS2 [Calditrichaeota bacterium]|nr:MAG: endonuclease MutS2 [Calditrichota bacterium]